MRKVFHGLLVVILITSMMIVPQRVQAKTLGQLKTELAKLQKEFRNNKDEQTQTKEQIATNKKKVEDLEQSISQIEEDVATLNSRIATLKKEIQDLNTKIAKKNKEIKKILDFVQVSSGENSYLEYIFGAKDFTDFIYRISVSEQMTNYNKDLISSFDKMVKDSKQKQKEIENKKQELAKKEEELEEKRSDLEIANLKLGKRLVQLSDIKMSIEEEIDLQVQAIQVLENMGCRDSEDINTCGQVHTDNSSNNSGSSGGSTSNGGSGAAATTTGFYRPIVTGYVTSEYARSVDPITGQPAFHEAIDLANTGTVPIYAAASGTVIGIRNRYYCGGNMIFILHTVNGVKYTTEYAHLRTINVSLGQSVTKDTMIATMGGDASKETWDQCAQVQHLHFGIAKGHYLKDYYSWDTFIANTFNPREIINFPWTGGSTDYFADRYTQY